MTIEERRLAFLNETVEFYSQDPKGRRAVLAKFTMPTCRYRTDDGRKCAIGRHIPDDLYHTGMEGALTTETMKTLPSEISELGISFLEAVQGLHDNNKYWDENGLTEQGHMKRRYIFFTFCTEQN